MAEIIQTDHTAVRPGKVRELLTPKQVARAIQVSESSVKRWCDKGAISTQYTVGGHRRIPMRAFLEFLRANRRQLLQPEVLGLPATSGQTQRVLRRAAQELMEALVAGDDERCRRIALDLYLAKRSVSCICDEVMAKAFEGIGSRWECGTAEVYQERRGCEIALRVLHELRVLVPPPPADAPLALGGTLEGDPYTLATTMVELVLRSRHWNAVSLGDNLPASTLAAAIRDHRPSLFWLSCSHIADESAFLADYQQLYDEFGLDVAFVVGGQALTDSMRRHMRYAAFCDTMVHLESFAETLHQTKK